MIDNEIQRLDDKLDPRYKNYPWAATSPREREDVEESKGQLQQKLKNRRHEMSTLEKENDDLSHQSNLNSENRKRLEKLLDPATCNAIKKKLDYDQRLTEVYGDGFPY